MMCTSLCEVTNEKQITNKKIIICILLIIVTIELAMVANNAIEIIKQHKIYEQYEAQLATLQKQEEMKQAQIKKRMEEKMPKLTRRRAKKHRKHISLRHKKSIFNI